MEGARAVAGAIDRALEALREGKPVMVYDSGGREGEVDLVYPAWSVTWREIRDLRVSAGGLICYASLYSILSPLGVRWASEIISNIPELKPLASKRPGYGDPPAFTIWVNHVSVRTGISDEDRAKTVRALDRVVELAYKGDVEGAAKMFREEFMAPGHVPILASRGLDRRRGHTELAVSLALLAGLRPSVVLAEMLGDRWSLSLEEARRVAEKRRIPLVTGDEVVEVCLGVEVCRSS
ncbi:MAG: 3,4-dihydroxy-2-butanone-4-phosphate synthase [Desulfurococcales archaeon]|nr:3,4-dihydroxy-2-butanone-4-phosphate synthase [Desulfurococcales archaeon]